MTATLILPRAARRQIEDAARAAWPRECCGLIEGIRTGSALVVTNVHDVRNVAVRDDRFELDPAAQFAVQRALRGTGRDVIGCYHSHPGGQPVPSEHDKAGAGEVGQVWLIAALEAGGPIRLGAYLFDGTDFIDVTVIDTASLDPALRLRV